MNSSKISRLHVFAHLESSWVPCGQLSLTEDGAELMASSFLYDRAYLLAPTAFSVDPVSLGIVGKRYADGGPKSPANGLPYFGAVRDAAPDAWGRRVIEAKLRASLNGLPESQHLIHAGSERVGALDIRSDASTPPLVGKDSWDTLPRLAEGADLIERGQTVPACLADIFVHGAALGGARPKAVVRDEHGILQVAKFVSTGDRFDVPAIEFATMKLAEKAGLRVPAVRLIQVNDRSVLLVRRFDRYWARPGGPTRKGDARFVRGGASVGEIEHRVPFVSGLTLAGCDEMESRSMSYATLGACMQKHCRALLAYDGLAELYQRMLFNIFVSNNDDHLRNLGFVWDAELRTWRLSPVYDLLPQPSIATERFQHLGVGTSGRLATLDNALSECERFQLPKRFACELIAEMWQVVGQWRAAFGEYGVASQDVDNVQSAFRHIDDISSASLRRVLP